MRCYFMKNGHIAAVEVLEEGIEDGAAIKVGGVLFLARIRDGFEGFEIWDRERVVFRYPEDDGVGGPISGNGKRPRAPAPKSGGKSGLALHSTTMLDQMCELCR